jgi:hypothetical protein
MQIVLILGGGLLLFWGAVLAVYHGLVWLEAHR